MKPPRCSCLIRPCPRWAVEESSIGAGNGKARSYTGEKRVCFTLTFMASEAAPDDEIAPTFVFDPAMPAMRRWRSPLRCWQQRGPIAGMARSYTGKKVYFTLKTQSFYRKGAKFAKGAKKTGASRRFQKRLLRTRQGSREVRPSDCFLCDLCGEVLRKIRSSTLVSLNHETRHCFH